MIEIKLGDIVNINGIDYIASKDNSAPCCGCVFCSDNKRKHVVCNRYACFGNRIVFKNI